MSQSTYEPAAVLEHLTALLPLKERRDFKEKWVTRVKARVTSWTDARSKSGQSAQKEQLMWISEIVEYVSHVWDVTKPSGGRNGRKISPALPSTILLLGPKFIPPNYHDHYRRRSAVNIAPRTANLKAVTIVHPVFFPELFTTVHGEEFHTLCKRCAVTRVLQDFIIETRPSGTNGRLAEHVKQLHLLEFHRCRLEYARFYQMLRTEGVLGLPPLCEFSVPGDPTGYADESITDDLIGDIYKDFHQRTRRDESDEYTRTRTGKILNFDTTYRIAKKASITIKGSEQDPILGQFSEITEVLEGVKTRYEKLNIEPPGEFVVDNCCQMASSVTPVFPDIHAALDVWHMGRRYADVIVNKSKNPSHSQIRAEITASILEKTAHESPTGRAILLASRKANRAPRVNVPEMGTLRLLGLRRTDGTVHKEQMKHADGSRIENLHRHLNALQRAAASGIEIIFALVSDFVLRWNIRVGTDNTPETTDICYHLLRHAFGSHHVRLVSQIAREMNTASGKAQFNLGVMPYVDSGESFGFTKSETTLTFGGLLAIKEEEWDDYMDDQQFNERAGVEMTYANSQPQVQEDVDMIDVTTESPGDGGEQVQASSVTQTLTVISSSSAVPDSSTAEPVTPATKRAHLDAPISSGKARTPEPAAKRARLDVDASKMSSSKRLAPIFTQMMTKSSQSSSTNIGTAASLPTLSTTTTPSPSSVTSTIDILITPLPRPSPKDFLFTTTGVHASSLTIETGSEDWFLFLKMRAELKWVAADMTPAKWAKATVAFNRRLDIKIQPKMPRALSQLLSKLETDIRRRLTTKDFKSQSGKEHFWKEHCYAVDALVQASATVAEKQRADQICKRCRHFKYPRSEHHVQYGNHPRSQCDDGVFSTATKILYPQPHGVFVFHSGGKVNGVSLPPRMEFRALEFLKALREVAVNLAAESSAETNSLLDLLAENRVEIDNNYSGFPESDIPSFTLLRYNLPQSNSILSCYFVP
ncbi:hypothetical protein BDZ89DRAFT_1135348 [Hymenopellis radicata]|nr:hypothetical protein BDZ89DRAFT_1135348 [Hymenopellis radicata]